jgi:hypothetical protein
MTPVGNGWYRCTVSRTALASSGAYWQINMATADNSLNFTGNGFSGIYIWGAQLEAGSFATSYIPTVASQVTRSSDAASMTGTNFSSWYRADAWTMYAEAMNRNGAITGTNFSIYSINDGTQDNESVARFAGSTTVTTSLGSNAGVANQWVLSGTATTIGTYKKVATAYALNNVAFSDSGATVSTDTSARIPPQNRLDIGRNQATTQPLNGTIKKLAYYTERLTNQELVGLTTV